MPAVDLFARVKRLVRIRSSALADLLSDGEAEWGPHEENTARLLEVQSYQLELAWIDRTADPDDREARLERLKAERAGIKPPKHPIVPPVALRPKGIAERRFEQYVLELAQQQGLEREKKQVGSDEFDRLMGLTEA